MADKLSYVQMGEQMQHIGFLKDMPDLSDEDRERLQKYLTDLASRQENKFDNIIGLIKKCDAYITALENELAEVKGNLDAWKRNKETLVNLIKFAYQQNLIGNKPTGVKYQGVFRRVRPKLVENFDAWDDKERAAYGLRRTVTLTRMSDNVVVESKEDQLPDKDRLREALAAEEKDVPAAAELVPGYSFIYERRKRLTEG